MKRLSITLLIVLFSSSFFGQVSFTDNTSLLPNTSYVSDQAIGVADMNGDGKDDIIQFDNGEFVYYAYQNGTEEEFTGEFIMAMDVPNTGSANVWGMCVGDVDNDGINDLVAGGFYNGIYIVRTEDEEYTVDVIDIEQIFVQGMNTFDINNDGFLDIFACDDVDVSDVYINDGTGNFTPDNSILYAESDDFSDNSGNYGSVFTDIDNNGHCDLFIAKCRQGVNDPADPRRINMAFMNYPDSDWASEGVDRGLASGAQSWIGDFGDMDNDGDLDLIVGNHDVDSRFYLNDGFGNFTDATVDAGLEGVFDFLTIQGSWVDFDNDTYLDFIMTGGESCVIAMNNGDGTFDTFDGFIGIETNSFALGDLNSDGFIDVFTSSNGYGGWDNTAEDRMFFNDGNNVNGYISIALQGETSNLGGVGARISISGPWGTQIQDVKSGQSYGIQHSLCMHFGVGPATMVDQISVTWPSGTVDTFTDISANQHVIIQEGGDVIQSVDELSNASLHLKLFPNPTTDFIQLDFDLAETDDLIFSATDATGKIVLTSGVLRNGDRIDVKNLSNGLYNYSLSQGSQVIFTGNFVKE